MVVHFSEDLIILGSETAESKIVTEVIDYIKKHGWISHSMISRRFRTRRGVAPEHLKRIIRNLQMEGLVQVGETKHRHGRKGLVYVWIGSNLDGTKE
jgi:ribosomal protein S25